MLEFNNKIMKIARIIGTNIKTNFEYNFEIIKNGADIIGKLLICRILSGC